jgi:hypothetical protein
MLIVKRGSFRYAAVQFFFTGGGQRSFLIVHQTAGFRRKGGWTARSLTAAEDPAVAALDLRKRKEARALAEVLAEMDLDDGV